MARSRRKAALLSALSLLAALALVSSVPQVFAQTPAVTCSASSLCPEASPCCSAEGVCGSGSMQCGGGCDPMSSFKPSSCLPNPVCRSRQMTIKPSDYNNNDVFMPVLQYNGNASSPFTLDSGSLGAGPEGVLLKLTAAQQAKISTTDYLMYGYVEATLRHNARQGLVAAFILMSSIKDEVDWEFTTSNSSLGMTNYFWMGQVANDHGADVSPPNFNVSDWHTYGFNWTSSQLQWTIDGNVVRTLTRAQAGSSYPRSPSRIQLSTWAGGNATNPQGTIEWAGGPIDWTSPEYKQNGFYSQEIKQFNVQCASLSSLNLTNSSANTSSTGNGDSGGDVTSFVYSGVNSSSTLEPAFGTSTEPLRTLSDPGADGIPGYPGYDAESTHSGKGDKDGKNSSDDKDSKSNSNDGDADNNDDAAKSSATSTSDALKYALPISGAIVGLAAVWGIIAFVRSRHLKAPIINAIGVTGVNDPRFSGPTGGLEKSSYNVAALTNQDPENDSSHMYRNEPNMNLMMGGGIMSDAGLSHLHRQTTGGSKASRSSSRITERLLGTSSRAQRYQQLDATLEEEGMDQVARQSIDRPVASSAYATHAYERAAQEDDEYVDVNANGLTYGGAGKYYGTPVSNRVQKNANAGARGYYSQNYGADQSFEVCQLQSPQRRALPSTPYSPNYASSPAAPPRPSGRMYDTPNVNYYPTPMMVQTETYVPNAPMAYGSRPHPHDVHSEGGDGFYRGGYTPVPAPRRY